MDRRKFLKTVMVGAAGVAVPLRADVEPTGMAIEMANRSSVAFGDARESLLKWVMAEKVKRIEKAMAVAMMMQER